ncbi:IS6 family transposase [Streptomyces hirsutus]|uniref:IS6 family transposase n=1 Tax=Streptomyces hirsutus TaxID=35620 RepID=UPI00340B2917
MIIRLVGSLEGPSVVTPSYRGFRFPPEVISPCVWLCHRFHRSLRDIKEPMLKRGIEVSHETAHQWTRRFGPADAAAPRRRRPGPGGTGHPDEVSVRINGVQRCPWRAVDQHGNVPGILLQNRRDTAAAGRFFGKLLKNIRSVPRVIVTDKLRSCGATHRAVMPSVEHRSHQGLNNQAENSHQPTRQRERAMKGFRSVGAAPRFLAAFSALSPHFRPRRHLMTATEHRLEMTIRFTLWGRITGVAGLPAVA